MAACWAGIGVEGRHSWFSSSCILPGPVRTPPACGMRSTSTAPRSTTPCPRPSALRAGSFAFLPPSHAEVRLQVLTALTLAHRQGRSEISIANDKERYASGNVPASGAGEFQNSDRMRKISGRSTYYPFGYTAHRRVANKFEELGMLFREQLNAMSCSNSPLATPVQPGLGDASRTPSSNGAFGLQARPPYLGPTL